jgi:hypothetical protein
MWIFLLPIALLSLYATVYYAVRAAINDSALGKYYARKNGVRKNKSIPTNEEIEQELLKND